VKPLTSLAPEREKYNKEERDEKKLKREVKKAFRYVYH
jgi:hypothetical protein